MINKDDFETRSAIRCSMIDAAGIVRILTIGGAKGINACAIENAIMVIAQLSPLVDGWLPERVERDDLAFMKIRVLPRD